MKKLSEFYSIVKSSANSKSIEEIIWVSLGQGINVILSLIIVKIISQIGPDNYGVYALIITIAALLGLRFGSFQQGFIRYFYDYKNVNKEEVFVNLFFKCLSFAVIFLLFLILIFSFISSGFLKEYSISFLITAGLMVVTTKVSELFNSWFNILRKRKINTILLSGEKGIIILSFVLLLFNKALTLGNVINFICISTLLFIIIKILTLKKFIHKNIDIEKIETNKLQKIMRKRVWIYATPFLIWAVAGWMQLNGEKWIINGILTLKDVGM